MKQLRLKYFLKIQLMKESPPIPGHTTALKFKHCSLKLSIIIKYGQNDGK